MPLMGQILLGLLAGIVLGGALNEFPTAKDWLLPNLLRPAGDLFIRMMQLIVVPLVFLCMVLAVSRRHEGQLLGRIALKTLGYFFTVTLVAILFGLTAGNLLRPGDAVGGGISRPASVHLPGTAGTHDLAHLLADIVPTNIIQAMADGKLLSVIFFAVLFGLGLSRLPADRRAPLLACFQAASDTMFRITGFAMAYSPIGIFAMMGVTVANFGFTPLLSLAKLIIVSYVTLITFAVVVFGPIALVARIHIFQLIRHMREELLLAASTGSSAAVLPGAMAKLETFGVPAALVAFVLPLGYAFNLDGTSLFLGVGTLFVAQHYGVDLAIADQALLVVTMVVTSKGAAGVTGFMYVILSATLSSAGLPLEGIALIAGIYRLIEMGTTALNVLGNSLAAVVIARWEGIPAGQLRPHLRNLEEAK
jgi:proton glutamate symport protein